MRWVARRGAVRSGVACAMAAALTVGCATRSADVRPRPTDAAAYAGWDCDRLHDELDRVQQRAADTAYAVDARAGNNMIALSLGVTVFWPALLAMRPDGPEAAELADLKGRFEALQTVTRQQACPPASEAMQGPRAAALPVSAGDRLVYDERDGRMAGSHTLGLRVLALKRDRIEFGVDLDGRAQPGAWSQDLSGNTLPESTALLLRWQHLLKPGLVLGQVVSGEMASGDDRSRRARLRGQVVAVGPQKFDERSFDVAVIELFGEAPQNADPASASTRLDGVMAVDRASGVLLRLELNSANREFSLRRRLLRVEPAAH